MPVGYRAGFAKYTEKLLNDSALAARISIAARQRAESEFSVGKMISRYADLYRQLLA